MTIELLPARALHDLARDTPDHEVLFDDVRALAVGELAAWAGAVGDRLVDGTGPVVALVDRRVASAAACFGAAWAGRGVAPIDAREPRTRIVEYLERVGATTVLDATGTVGREFAGRRVVDVTAVGRASAEPAGAHPDDVAVLFFTSGSTGRPKCIARSFATANALFALWSAANASEGTESGAVFLPMNFVGGFGPVIHATTVGRRVFLVDLTRTSPLEMADIVDRAAIRRLTVTPSMISTLAASLSGRRLDGVDEVFGVGEPTDWTDVAAVRSFASPRVVYRTLYGASETGGAVTVGMTIGPEVPIGVGRLPLGPMPGPERARIESVDGVDGVGELIVRGSLIEGYWGDPDLTAERFGVDAEGVRFWRSGDLVRVDELGMLHLLGRADDMVKVNGRLVEPAEPERVIRAVPGVRAAVVLPRRLRSGRQQMVGHVEAARTVPAASVRDALVHQLPGHLVPAVLVRHDRLPTLPGGKIDRSALRAGTVVPWRDGASADAPSVTGPDGREPTRVETAVMDAVALVLDLESVAPDDDIWRIGCDSLAAIELVEVLHERLGSRLLPNDLVEASTAAAIARRVEAGRGERRGARSTVVHPDGSRPPVYLVCGAGAPAIQYRSLAMALGADQPVVLMEQLGLHHRGWRDRSIGGAARRHVAEIRTPADTPVVLCGHSYGAVVANEMARSLAASGRAVRLVVLDPIDVGAVDRRARRPVNLRVRRGPVVVHGLKLAWWGLHRLRARFPGPGRPGSERRYLAFYRIGAALAGRHRVVAFDGPTLLVRAAAQDTPVRWPPLPCGEAIVVPGDHNTIVQQPFVAETARVVGDWIEGSSVDGASTGTGRAATY